MVRIPRWNSASLLTWPFPKLEGSGPANPRSSPSSAHWRICCILDHTSSKSRFLAAAYPAIKLVSFASLASKFCKTLSMRSSITVVGLSKTIFPTRSGNSLT